MELITGLVVDAKGVTEGIGQFVPDLFDKSLSNIEWRVNNTNRPDCLIGYANRPLEAGSKLVAMRGKKF